MIETLNTPLFIAALFAITKLWNQSRCPSTDEGIKKNISSAVLFCNKEWNYVVCMKMDGTGDHVNQSQPNSEWQNIACSLTCRI
jgi:hypothetical protein